MTAAQEPRPTLLTRVDGLWALALWAVWNARFTVGSGVGIGDWPKEIFYYLHARHAMTIEHRLPGPFGELPSVLLPYPAFQGSRGYWSNPEVLGITPWLGALGVLNLPVFVKVYYLAHALAGTLGAIALARRWSLGWAPSLLLLAFTVLGPWPMQHYAVGYSPHCAALLAPWVLLALDRPRRDGVAALLAGAIASQMVHQGGLHAFLWLLGLTGLVCSLAALGGVTLVRPLRLAGFFAAAVGFSLPRLVATLGAYRGLRRTVLLGYRDTWHALEMVLSPAPYWHPAVGVGTSRWDAAHHLGVVGLLALCGGTALVAVRAARGLRERSLPPAVRVDLALVAAGALCVSFGGGGRWKALASVLPLLDVERYPYRFLALGVFLLGAVAAREGQRLAAEHPRLAYVVAAVALAVAATAFVEYQAASAVATSVPLGAVVGQVWR